MQTKDKSINVKRDTAFVQYIKVCRCYGIPIPVNPTIHKLSRVVRDSFAHAFSQMDIIAPDCLGGFEIKLMHCQECEVNEICELLTYEKT